MPDDKKNVKDIIDFVVADLKSKSEGGGKVYRDEPILLRPASQLPGYLPPKYREMRKLITPYDTFSRSSSWIFCKQGRFMADFEDDYPFTGDFVRYFPTYQSMSDRELRGYFTFRTKVRNGKVEKAPLSFAFLYLYELINQIGVTDPLDGFRKLCTFKEAYTPLDAGIERYLAVWMTDYVVYYGLDRENLASSPETAFDNALLTLLDENASDEALFTALLSLSNYAAERSRCYKKHPALFAACTVRVWRLLEAYYAKNRKSPLVESLFGRPVSLPYYMFNSAVFYDEKKYADYTYEIAPNHRYTCKNGVWRCEKYYGSRAKNKTVGLILKTVDNAIRLRHGEKTLAATDAPQYLSAMCEQALAAVAASKRAAAIPKVEIDTTRLDAIRASAAATRDSLLTDEDRADDPLPAEAPALASPPEPVTEAASDAPLASDLPLDETETAFLRALLTGAPYRETLRGSGRLTSVVCDAVNDKLFDIFADTVIVFDGDDPVVLEDYAADIKEMLHL